MIFVANIFIVVMTGFISAWQSVSLGNNYPCRVGIFIGFYFAQLCVVVFTFCTLGGIFQLWCVGCALQAYPPQKNARIFSCWGEIKPVHSQRG
jgi:hypothetical protein